MGKASLLILSLPESIRTPSSFFCFPSGFSRGSFLGGGCSILLSYGDVYEILRWGPPQKVSAPRSLRRRVLYPAELRGHLTHNRNSTIFLFELQENLSYSFRTHLEPVTVHR